MIGQDLLNIFGESPIKPIQKHMATIHECVFYLKPFFESVIANNWDAAKKYYDSVMILEERADELKKGIRLHLPRGLFMPVSRIDILSLLTVQDKIASKAKHLTGLVYSRKMVLPDSIAKEYLIFVNRCLDASFQANQVIHKLDELIETGFRENEVKAAEAMILELDAIERDTDKMQLSLRMALFAIEEQLPPVEVIFLYKIIDWMGELADRAQLVGHRLETLLAK